MENKCNAGTAGCTKSFLFLAAYLSLLLCGYKPEDQKPVMSQVENQQTVRNIQVLSGDWGFQLDIMDLGEKERWFNKDLKDWGKVTVPLAWNCYEDALWQYEGIGWYTTVFKPDESINGRKTEIVFGRVMYLIT